MPIHLYILSGHFLTKRKKLRSCMLSSVSQIPPGSSQKVCSVLGMDTCNKNKRAFHPYPGRNNLVQGPLGSSLSRAPVKATYFFEHLRVVNFPSFRVYLISETAQGFSNQFRWKGGWSRQGMKHAELCQGQDACGLKHWVNWNGSEKCGFIIKLRNFISCVLLIGTTVIWLF